jgi:hypothetical protein
MNSNALRMSFASSVASFKRAQQTSRLEARLYAIAAFECRIPERAFIASSARPRGGAVPSIASRESAVCRQARVV